MSGLEEEEDALQMAVPQLVQRMLRGQREDSQLALDSDDDPAVTLDDGTVWKSYRQREPDEAVRASGERPSDLKSPLSIGDDVMARTPDTLDASRPPTEASEKTDPAAGQVGDFQHDVSRGDKPPEASRDDTLSEGLPAVDGAAAPARTAPESDVKRADVADASPIPPEAVREVRHLPEAKPNLAAQKQTISKERADDFENRAPVIQEASEEQILRRRPISVASTGDSATSSKPNVVFEEGPPSTKSSRSQFGDSEGLGLALRGPVHAGSTQTEELSTSDASTQTSTARVGYQKTVAGIVSLVFILLYLYLCYVLTLYTKHFYETDIQDELDFL